MINIAVIIWVLSEHNLTGWWWLFAPCIVIDLIHIGYKVAK